MKFTCEICLEDELSSHDKFLMSSCKHENFCKSCIGKHINANLERGISHITCPKCRQLIDPSSCLSIVSEHNINKWRTMLAARDQGGGERTTMLPLEREHIVVVDPDLDQMFFSLAQTRAWARCPNCNFYVERADGCNAIRCRCGALFCYRCGRLTFDHGCCINEAIAQDQDGGNRCREESNGEKCVMCLIVFIAYLALCAALMPVIFFLGEDIFPK